MNHAIKMSEEWDAKRRYADTKSRYWNRRVKYYAKKVSDQARLDRDHIEKGQRAITFN